VTAGLAYNPRVIALDRDNIGSPPSPNTPIPSFAPYKAKHVDAARIGGGRRVHDRLLPLLSRQHNLPSSLPRQPILPRPLLPPPSTSRHRCLPQQLPRPLLPLRQARILHHPHLLLTLFLFQNLLMIIPCVPVANLAFVYLPKIVSISTSLYLPLSQNPTNQLSSILIGPQL
jgi:hypothetical protein